MPLPHQLASQDHTFAAAFRILEAAVATQAFPGAVCAITAHGNLVALRGFRHFTYHPDSPAVEATTVFDLASLTKPLATTAVAMLLCDRNLLNLATPLSHLLPEFLSAAAPDPRRASVTLHHLLAHSSGLPAHKKFYLTCRSPEDMWQAIFATPLEHMPGPAPVYSDIGFMLLGLALQRITGEPLDFFCAHQVFTPLGMEHTEFRPAAAANRLLNPVETIAPTGYAPLRENPLAENAELLLQGIVNDGNCRALGGVSGHAGLFAPAVDVATFAESMLRASTQFAPLFTPETIARFTTRESDPPGTSRTLGWDTPTPPSSSGRHFSARAFGHLGYTGTSLWIDPDRELSVTLLTNRTMPLAPGNPRPKSDFDAIKRIRPAFHDAVVQALA